MTHPGPIAPGCGHRHTPARSRWAAFVHRWGWRAYALPVLTLVTIAALVLPGSAPARPRTTAGGSSAPPGFPTAATSDGAARVQVEGRQPGDGRFAAGSTPAPVVVNLGDDAISCATNTHAKLVLVSLRTQHLWACEGGRQVRSTAVTTGATVDGDQTPRGSWRVQAKQRNRYLVGAGYRDYVHYWVPFNGDFGLHDASWQTMPFGSADYTTAGSHGCVHVPTATMAWLYRWAAVGNTVVTVES